METVLTQKNYAAWALSLHCNYTCNYCFLEQDKSVLSKFVLKLNKLFGYHSSEKRVAVESVLSLLGKTRKTWTVALTGGEPILFPNFLDICKKITEHYPLIVFTNLSIPKRVESFCKTIDPKKVELFVVSLHIKEREQRNAIDQVVQSIQLLKTNLFPVQVYYVLHPTLLNRYGLDVEIFKKKGITLLPKPFVGVYKNKRYPDSYTADIKRMIKETSIMLADFTPLNLKHIPCTAGKNFIVISPSGDILRCFGDFSILGSVSKGVHLQDSAKPCNVAQCPCYGVKFIEGGGSMNIVQEQLRNLWGVP